MRSLATEYLIVGGGPAGLTMARLLALKGRQVLLVDAATKPPKRLELIAPIALETMAKLGLLQLLDDPALARPCLGIRRRRGSSDDHEDFLGHPHRAGYVVDRAQFDARLRAAASAAGVDCRDGRVHRVDRDNRTAMMRAGAGDATEVHFSGAVVDATGRAATVARRLGARIAVRQHMIAEMIEDANEEDSDGPAWLDFEQAGSGWCYRIRGPNGRLQGWAITDGGSRPHRTGACRVDASSAVLSEAAGLGWLAIGDASASFDPIASQGLYHALSSALVAAGLLQSGPLDLEHARLYATAVLMTHARSETARRGVYNAMQGVTVGPISEVSRDAPQIGA